jgi:hypothetical protein
MRKLRTTSRVVRGANVRKSERKRRLKGKLTLPSSRLASSAAIVPFLNDGAAVGGAAGCRRGGETTLAENEDVRAAPLELASMLPDKERSVRLGEKLQKRIIKKRDMKG